MTIPHALPVLTSLTLLLAACGKDIPEEPPAEPQPSPVRIRLFDLMQEAEVKSAAQTTAPGERKEWRYDFSSTSPPELWFGRAGRRTVTWLDEGMTVAEDGGLEGGSLRLGPGMESDRCRAVFLVPSRGRSRVRVRARVKLLDNPSSHAGSTREVLRIVEHRAEVTSPKEEGLRAYPSARVSRRIDPSGWDVVDQEIVTDGSTRTLQIQLLHRTGGSDASSTVFDDVWIEETPLDEPQLISYLATKYRPRDGQESQTPWRLRVELRGDVRDATLVNVDGELAFPMEVPKPESKPLLRFAFGALPETRRQKGDGSVLSVVFLDEGGEQVIGEETLDVKNGRKQHGWNHAQFDLSAVAGRTGKLAFRVRDVEDEPDAEAEPDDLDAILIATPRIEPADEVPAGMNILLIGVDTLRADHLSAFGYDRSTTPVLKALGEEGVRFMGTRSQAPWTLPSFSSILTSLYPSAHGAGRGGHDEWEGIDPTTLALPEILQRSGYETAGIVANGLISPRYGLDQGFDSYQAAWAMESVERDTPRVVDFVESHERTPWLLFWHIMDPHLPYDTKAVYRKEMTDPEYDGRFAGSQPKVPFQVLDPRPNRRWYTHEGPPPMPELSEDDARFVSDYYDAEIAEVDAAIGKVLDAIRASGQWDRTIIALVADHGEGLGDHNHYHHGYTLFDDQVHIPMLVRIPGAHVGTVVDRPVAAIDLAPTLLGALGIPLPESFQGVDRLALDAPKDDHFFIEYPTYDSSAQKAWVEGRFKYMHDPLYHTEALYDFVADPRESQDIAGDHPEVVARARKDLDAFRLEQIDVGRFHLRLRGKKGQRLTLRVKTNDLFDANFVSLPSIDENHFEMDLDRSYLAVDTVLTNGRQEIVFWCRGSQLEVEASLDGEPLEGLTVREGRAAKPFPATLARREIEETRKADGAWPELGMAELWLEEGAGDVLPVVNTPEEIERLKELGYGH